MDLVSEHESDKHPTQYRPVLKGFETRRAEWGGPDAALYAVPPRFEGV